nr:hypothetical protein SHINE37_60091 [Rhizobiaceae bacterium]
MRTEIRRYRLGGQVLDQPIVVCGIKAYDANVRDVVLVAGTRMAQLAQPYFFGHSLLHMSTSLTIAIL